MISYTEYGSPDIFHCPNCGYDIFNEFNIDSFVNQIKNIKPSGINNELLMHTFPQSLFINNSPYTGPEDLKIYSLDQIDHIFNTKLLKENFIDINNARYKLFEKNFEDQYSKYDSFLNSHFVDDFKLWNSRIL